MGEIFRRGPRELARHRLDLRGSATLPTETEPKVGFSAELYPLDYAEEFDFGFQRGAIRRVVNALAGEHSGIFISAQVGFLGLLDAIFENSAALVTVRIHAAQPAFTGVEVVGGMWAMDQRLASLAAAELPGLIVRSGNISVANLAAAGGVDLHNANTAAGRQRLEFVLSLATRGVLIYTAVNTTMNTTVYGRTLPMLG